MPNPQSSSGGLAGIRVLDLTRLAPGPYCSMLLADMGAEVIVVGGGSGSLPIPALSRGKTFVRLDLKAEQGRAAFHALAKSADVVIEGYRPGVVDRLGIGYGALRELNPGLIYCSLTGYGQDGPLSQEAGHDINYIAISGALGAFGPTDAVPAFPLNLLADFAGGSLFAALGILSALYQRAGSGEGQYIDAAMVDGCLSLMAMHFPDWGKPVLASRGDGLVAGTAPQYRCYACADGRFVAVGPLERRFFENLWRGLGYEEPVPDHLDRTAWPALAKRFEATFAERTRDEWAAHFAGLDACVSPVLDPDEAVDHPHNRHRHPELGKENAALAPLMSAVLKSPQPTDLTDKTEEVLKALGLDADAIAGACPPQGAIEGLAWPPM